jgi:micrococcal nuclease
MNKIFTSLLVFLAILILQYALQEEPPVSGNDAGGVTAGGVTGGGETSSDGFDQVSKVVDGDTIDVTVNGETARVRLIGINTPETVDPRKPVECYGKEASDFAKETLTGKKVRLEADPTQTDRDKYDRLLRYVFLEDGTNFNELMVARGYAYEYTYDAPYKYQKEFKAAQKFAEDNKRGLWAEGVCP